MTYQNNTTVSGWIAPDHTAKISPAVKYAMIAITAAVVVTPGLPDWFGQNVVLKPATKGARYLGDYPVASAQERIEDDQQFTSQEIQKWIAGSGITFTTLTRLTDLIHSVFGPVPVTSSLYLDIEEGWEKLVLTVDSGNEDFEQIMRMEEELFKSIEKDASLVAALQSVIIVQA